MHSFHVPATQLVTLEHGHEPRVACLVGEDSDDPLTRSQIEGAHLCNKTLCLANFSPVRNHNKTWMGNAIETVFDLSGLRKPWTKEGTSFIWMRETFPFPSRRSLGSRVARRPGNADDSSHVLSAD